MGKKRLLFVNGHLNVGGVEKTLLDLLNALDYEKYDVDLLLFEEKGDFLSQLNNRVHVKTLNLKRIYGPMLHVLFTCLRHLDFSGLICRILLNFWGRGNKQALSIFRRLVGICPYYDVAIAYRTSISTDFVAWGVRAQKKMGWWHHGTFELSERAKEALQNAWERMDDVVCVSSACKEMLQSVYPQLKSKMRVMHNVVNVVEIQANAQRHANIRSGTFVTVGRISYQKHIENAVHAASKLKARGYSFRWVIVGDGEDREAIEALITKENVPDRIFLVGQQINPYPYILQSEIYVHTSFVEAHCTSILEAMALSKPSVVTRTELPQDFTCDGLNCIIAEQNVDSLVECIERLWTDKKLQESLVANAIATVDEYSPENIVAQFEKLISG